MKVYNSNSKLDFGLYKGYDLDVVYVFDPAYIEWCIKNIDGFCVIDLVKLQDMNVSGEKISYEQRIIRLPHIITNINEYQAFKYVYGHVDMDGDEKYSFSEKTLIINSDRLDDLLLQSIKRYKG